MSVSPCSAGRHDDLGGVGPVRAATVACPGQKPVHRLRTPVLALRHSGAGIERGVSVEETTTVIMQQPTIRTS